MNVANVPEFAPDHAGWLDSATTCASFESRQFGDDTLSLNTRRFAFWVAEHLGFDFTMFILYYLSIKKCEISTTYLCTIYKFVLLREYT